MADGRITSISMSQDMAEAILPVTVLFGILAVVGILGNAVVFYFYKFKYSPCNFRYFVMFMACFDFVDCVIMIPMEMSLDRNWFSFQDKDKWLCVIKKVVTGLVICFTACVFLLISIDRYLKIYRPLGRQLAPKRALQLCFAILIVLVVLYTPSVVVFGKQTSNVTYEGQTIQVYTCQRADETKNEGWTRIYVVIVFFIPTIGSTIVSTVLYGIVVKAIFSRFQHSTPREKKNTNAAHMDELCHSTHMDSGEMEATSTHVTIVDDYTTTRSSDHASKEEESTESVTKEKRSRPSAAKVNDNRARKVINRTVMMLIVTAVFDVTMIVYFVMYVLVLKNGHLLKMAPKQSVGVIFSLWRLYFLNHIINPFVYGFLDRKFREFIKGVFKKCHCMCCYKI